MGRAAVDERGFEMVRRIREAFSEVSLEVFKTTVREQFLMLLIDAEAALSAIPSMLPDDRETRSKAFNLISEVLSARGEYSVEDRGRIERVGELFGIDARLDALRLLAIAAGNPDKPEAKAS